MDQSGPEKPACRSPPIAVAAGGPDPALGAGSGRKCHSALEHLDQAPALGGRVGRVSISETRSPIPASPFSSWALTFLVVRMILP